MDDIDQALKRLIIWTLRIAVALTAIWGVLILALIIALPITFLIGVL